MVTVNSEWRNMARINLTAGRIRDFATEKGQSFLWDSEVPGLAVRATAPSKRNPCGGKAFVFQATMANSQDMRITIGSVTTWEISKAREEARTLQKLIDQGLDPRQEKRERIVAIGTKRENERRAEASALDAWKTYIDERSLKWGAASLHDHTRFADKGGRKITRGRKKGAKDTTEPGILHVLLCLPLASIDSEAVRAWLKVEVPRRPTVTSLAYRLLRAFLNWCSNRTEYQALVNVNACAPRVARDLLPKKSAKDDCLQREQLALWFEHVRKLENPVHAAYLQALLLTGSRREELAGLQWDDVDFQWKSLVIKDKVEGVRTIPLTPYVASLLAVLPRRTMEHSGEIIPNPWVFSSPSAATGRLQEPRIGHNKALAAAGLPSLSLHGLRRSFGTLAEWVECPAGVAAQIMGHKPSATAEKHYRVRPLDLLRVWHTRIEDWVLEQAGINTNVPTSKPELKETMAETLSKSFDRVNIPRQKKSEEQTKPSKPVPRVSMAETFSKGFNPDNNPKNEKR